MSVSGSRRLYPLPGGAPASGACARLPQVGLLDVDLCGPSIPRMLRVQGRAVHQCDRGWLPVFVDQEQGISLMSVGFLLEKPDEAVVWRGPKKNGNARRAGEALAFPFQSTGEAARPVAGPGQHLLRGPPVRGARWGCGGCAPADGTRLALGGGEAAGCRASAGRGPDAWGGFPAPTWVEVGVGGVPGSWGGVACTAVLLGGPGPYRGCPALAGWVEAAGPP